MYLLGILISSLCFFISAVIGHFGLTSLNWNRSIGLIYCNFAGFCSSLSFVPRHQIPSINEYCTEVQKC